MSELTKIAAGQTPAKRRSKLDPHLADLRRLQSEGYSLAQLKTFLGKIGVTVSRQSIYDFLKRRESVATTLGVNQHADQEREEIKGPATPDLTDYVTGTTTDTPAGAPSGKPAVETKKPASAGKNPLHVLSGKPKENDFNHIPAAQIEIDND